MSNMVIGFGLFRIFIYLGIWIWLVLLWFVWCWKVVVFEMVSFIYCFDLSLLLEFLNLEFLIGNIYFLYLWEKEGWIYDVCSCCIFLVGLFFFWIYVLVWWSCLRVLRVFVWMEYFGFCFECIFRLRIWF